MGRNGDAAATHAVSGIFRFAQFLGDGEVFLVEPVGRVSLFRGGQAGGDAGEPHFEGRETAKTALYFRISSYRLSAKSLVNKGFSCIL